MRCWPRLLPDSKHEIPFPSTVPSAPPPHLNTRREVYMKASRLEMRTNSINQTPQAVESMAAWTGYNGNQNSKIELDSELEALGYCMALNCCRKFAVGVYGNWYGCGKGRQEDDALRVLTGGRSNAALQDVWVWVKYACTCVAGSRFKWGLCGTKRWVVINVAGDFLLLFKMICERWQVMFNFQIWYQVPR